MRVHQALISARCRVSDCHILTSGRRLRQARLIRRIRNSRITAPMVA